MTRQRSCTAGIAVSILATAFVASSASTQECEPTWDATLGNPGISRGFIQPMVAWDDGTGEKLYVGGSAENIGGAGVNDYLAQYDPAIGEWSRLGTGIGQGTTNAFLTTIMPWDDGTGEKLYVTGQFATAGGQAEANSFAVWDGSEWSDVGAGFDQTVARVTYDLLPADLGDGEKLYLAGNWSEIGGVQASGLAWFDGENFGAWGTGDGIGRWGGFSPFVADLEMWDDGSGPAIYACGRFEGIDNAQTTNVARYNIAAGEWEAFGQPHFPESNAGNNTSFAVFDDGTGEALYPGGQRFRISGDPNIYVVAKWDGTEWTGVGQELSGRVTDLAVWDDGNGPALYLSGTSTFEVNYFAKLVGDTWVPAQSGVNNPPVNGNFSSAFGLYVWGPDLLVGGNFSQVGGLDPVTGVGEGDPIPARGIAALEPCGGVQLTDFAILTGSLLDGGLADLETSNDSYVHTRSGFGETFVDLHNMTMLVNAATTVDNPATLDLTIESRIDQPAGTARVSLRNWATGEFEQVDTFPLGDSDDVHVTAGIDATNYVNTSGGGQIDVEIRHIVFVPFLAFTFESFIDHVEMTLE